MTKTFCIVGAGVLVLAVSVLAALGADTSAAQEAKFKANIEKLPAEDQPIALAQRFCAIENENRLGSMGVPLKLMIEGQPVFLCCGGCKQRALANPKATLETVKKLKAANA